MAGGLDRIRCSAAVVAQSLADRKGAAEHFRMAASAFLRKKSRVDASAPQRLPPLSGDASTAAVVVADSSAGNSAAEYAVSRNINVDAPLHQGPEASGARGRHLGAIKQGWLLKLSLFSNSWQRRWFVLVPDQLLSFSDEVQTQLRDHLLDDVKLCKQCVVEKEPRIRDTCHSHIMRLETATDIMHLAAPCFQEQMDWMRSIQKQVLAQPLQRRPSNRSPRHRPPQLQALKL